MSKNRARDRAARALQNTGARRARAARAVDTTGRRAPDAKSQIVIARMRALLDRSGQTGHDATRAFSTFTTAVHEGIEFWGGRLGDPARGADGEPAWPASAALSAVLADVPHPLPAIAVDAQAVHVLALRLNEWVTTTTPEQEVIAGLGRIIGSLVDEHGWFGVTTQSCRHRVRPGAYTDWIAEQCANPQAVRRAVDAGDLVLCEDEAFDLSAPGLTAFTVNGSFPPATSVDTSDEAVAVRLADETLRALSPLGPVDVLVLPADQPGSYEDEEDYAALVYRHIRALALLHTHPVNDLSGRVAEAMGPVQDALLPMFPDPLDAGRGLVSVGTMPLAAFNEETDWEELSEGLHPLMRRAVLNRRNYSTW
jgi:hypothetical protein